MYGMSGFAENLNIHNYLNSTVSLVHNVANVWICRKFECPEQQKFIGKLCTLYMYGMSRFAEKLNIQRCENSTENCVRYTCTECPN